MDQWPAKLLAATLIVFEVAICLKKTRIEWLRITAFGLGWFLIATLPVTIFEGRLFLRYSYFGHAIRQEPVAEGMSV